MEMVWVFDRKIAYDYKEQDRMPNIIFFGVLLCLEQVKKVKNTEFDDKTAVHACSII